MKVSMIAHLVETGEMENLKNLLKRKLIESGWRDDMKILCKEIVQKKGVDKITVDELVQAVTTKGREKVCEDIKRELLYNIRTVLKSANDVL